jgi:nucleoside-triphosphatase THEP1
MKNKEPELIITVAGRVGSGKTLISLAIADYLTKFGLNVKVDDIDGECAMSDGTPWWSKIPYLRDKKINILINQKQISSIGLSQKKLSDYGKITTTVSTS